MLLLCSKGGSMGLFNSIFKGRDAPSNSCVEESVADHCAYLLGAKNGSKLRYDGLKMVQ